MLKLKLQFFGHLRRSANSLGWQRPCGKDPDAEKDWGQEEKGVTEDEKVAQYHQFNGHGFEQTVRNSEGQGNPACWNPWGHKELDMTEGLNNNRLTLFDLWTNWTYERALRTELIYMEGTYYSSFLFIPTLHLLL